MGLGPRSREGVGQGHGLPPAGQDMLIMISEPVTLGTAVPGGPAQLGSP